MRLLLDTHTLLWWHDGSLPARVISRIQGADDVCVSAATAWEVAIKSGLGKLRLDDSVANVTRLYGFAPLPIQFEHAEHVATLPALHADPFDRLLVAQAILEGLTLVTNDKTIPRYAVATLWSG